MRTVTKPVYYCDFCKIRRLAKPAMELHERHCTMNHNRKCRVCGGRSVSCPMCQFAVQRQAGLDLSMPYHNLEAEVKKWYRDQDEAYESRAARGE